MTDTPKIYAALAAAAKDVGAVGKDKTNTGQNYKFRGIDAVVNAVHPAFTKHGIVTALKVLDQKREERTSKGGATLIYSLLHCEVTFYATDGSSVTCGAMGEGMDSGDKASNKAMSAALKYALTQTLMIPFELYDSEDDNPEPAAKVRPQMREQERKAEPEKKPEPDAKVEALDKRINKAPIGTARKPANRYDFNSKPKGAVLAGWENKQKYWCEIHEMTDAEMEECHRTLNNQMDYEEKQGKDTKWTLKELAAVEVELRERGMEIPTY